MTFLSELSQIFNTSHVLKLFASLVWCNRDREICGGVRVAAPQGGQCVGRDVGQRQWHQGRACQDPLSLQSGGRTTKTSRCIPFCIPGKRFVSPFLFSSFLFTSFQVKNRNFQFF